MLIKWDDSDESVCFSQKGTGEECQGHLNFACKSLKSMSHGDSLFQGGWKGVWRASCSPTWHLLGGRRSDEEGLPVPSACLSLQRPLLASPRSGHGVDPQDSAPTLPAAPLHFFPSALSLFSSPLRAHLNVPFPAETLL